MNLSELCREIRLSDSMTARVLEAEPAVRPVAGSPEAEKMMHPDTWNQGLAETKKLLGEDPDGVKILTCMLLFCGRTWEICQKYHISREIFRDTMMCFPRFISEHVESYGTEAFDRAFWTVRQIGGYLFRIGTLEYELVASADPLRIDVHIPSDADLSTEALRESYDRARELINTNFPEYRTVPMCCESWLLGPQLKDFLPESSRILGFQKNFRLTKAEDSDDIRQWVFKNPDLPTEGLPENSSLQRNLKKFLLSGGVFQNGEGILQEPAFR